MYNLLVTSPESLACRFHLDNISLVFLQKNLSAAESSIVSLGVFLQSSSAKKLEVFLFKDTLAQEVISCVRTEISQQNL